MQIGENIRAERKRQGRTLEEIAGRVSLSDGQLSKIERGEASLLIDHFFSICAALNVLPGYLLPQQLGGLDDDMRERAHRIMAIPPTRRPQAIQAIDAVINAFIVQQQGRAVPRRADDDYEEKSPTNPGEQHVFLSSSERTRAPKNTSHRPTSISPQNKISKRS